MATISNNTSKRITEEPVHKNFLANKNRHTTSSVISENYNENMLISHIITGIKNTSQNDPRLAGGVTQLPTNGIRTQVSSANRSSTSSNRNDTEDRSVVIYDHLGNLVTKT